MTAAMRNTANEMAAALRRASRELEKVITHLAHVDSLLADRTSSITAECLDPRADVLRLIASCRAAQLDWLAKSERIERYEKQLVRERGPAASPVAQAEQTCPQPVWDGPYRMRCGHLLVDGVCRRHGMQGRTGDDDAHS